MNSQVSRSALQPGLMPPKHKNKDRDREVHRPPRHGEDPREMRKPPHKPEYVKPEPRRDRDRKNRYSRKRK